jgi:hypothetical protein
MLLLILLLLLLATAVAGPVVGKNQHPFAFTVPHLAVSSFGVATRIMAMASLTSFQTKIRVQNW